MTFYQDRRRYLRAVVALFPLIGCGREQKPQQTTSSSTPRSVDSIQTQISAAAPASRTGPRLVIDSAAAEPRIDTLDTEFIVRVPLKLAQILEDSFPKFSLFSRSNYASTEVANIDRNEPQKSPLTATAGDFDGDGRRDLAMLGRSSNAVFAFVILLSDDQPRLLILEHQFAPVFDSLSEYISLVKPQTMSGYGGRRKTELKLATDGIQKEIVEKLSLLIYLDHGLVKQLQLSEPD